MKKTIAIIDTETTGLLEAEGASLSFQPYITEIYCLKLNKKLKPIDEMDQLIKPPIPIPDYITKITGIDDYMVSDAPSFLDIFDELAKIFLGCQVLVAHNLSFDLNVIRFELQRIGKEFNFPYPPEHFCTVEQSLHLKGHRLKNYELHELVTGEKFITGAHRAKADVMATYENYKWLVKNVSKPLH